MPKLRSWWQKRKQKRWAYHWTTKDLQKLVANQLLERKKRK